MKVFLYTGKKEWISKHRKNKNFTMKIGNKIKITEIAIS
jgi:hypothetical protein